MPEQTVSFAFDHGSPASCPIPTMKIRSRSAGLPHAVGLGHDGIAGDDRDAGKPGLRRAGDGLWPDRGQISIRRSWPGLDALTSTPPLERIRPLRRSSATCASNFIGSLRGFHGKNVAAGDNRGLTHIGIARLRPAKRGRAQWSP